MKQVLILFTVVVMSPWLMAQEDVYNLKDGFIAEGYDVVAYFDGMAVDGDDAFKSHYDGVGFRFSSLENKNKFDAAPEKFVPEYGGWCAYAVAKNNSKVSINPETFEVRDGKLYLFYNAFFTNTLKSWKKEGPEELRKLADENWPTLR